MSALSPELPAPEELAIREGLLAWTRASAAGELEGLSWVELETDPDAPAYREVQQEGSASRFRQRVLTRFLPLVFAQAAASAAEAGLPTAIDGLHLAFARSEWTLAALEHLLGPLTPAPALLSLLVEPYGVGPELHQDDNQRLLRLVALLPRWYPWRGTLARALEVLDACGIEALDAATQPAPTWREVFVCRGEAWFRARREPPPSLVVRDGLLRASTAPTELAPEDVALVCARPSDAGALARLLPAWTTTRLFMDLEEDDGPVQAR